jgi:hypothetical protein
MPILPIPGLIAPTELLVWALVAHIVADWLLQTEWMAVHKTSLHHPAAYAHAGVYALGMWFVFPWPLALGIGAVHLLVDTRVPVHWWMRVIKRMPFEAGSGPRTDPASNPHVGVMTTVVEAAVDQALHVVTIVAAIGVLMWPT